MKVGKKHPPKKKTRFEEENLFENLEETKKQLEILKLLFTKEYNHEKLMN